MSNTKTNTRQSPAAAEGGEAAGDGLPWVRPPAPGRWQYWHRLVGLFFAGWVLIYANRTVLAPFLSLLETRWGMTRSQLGLLNSAFFLMYTLLQVPTGFLADRFGRRILLLPGYLIHAIGAAASGLAGNANAFLAARVITGIGQSTYYSTQYALASAAIPRQSRALGMAVINSGMAFGIAAGMIAASTALAAGLDWRFPFLVLAGLTFALTVAMTRLVRADAPAGRAVGGPAGPAAKVGGAERAKEQAGPAVDAGGRLPVSRNVSLAYFIAFATMYGFFVILTWLPYYLENPAGMTGASSGLVSTGVAFAAVPAGVFAGRLSDRLGKRRPVLLALTPLAGLALAVIVSARSTGLVVAAIIVYGITGKLVVDPLLVAMVADATPPGAYGRAFGILNFAGTISTVLAPALTGLIADWTGSFTNAFLLAAGLQWAASLCIMAMRPEGARTVVSARSPAGEGAS